eukprot:1126629-Prymnesium_polylepis.3
MLAFKSTRRLPSEAVRYKCANIRRILRRACPYIMCAKNAGQENEARSIHGGGQTEHHDG